MDAESRARVLALAGVRSYSSSDSGGTGTQTAHVPSGPKGGQFTSGPSYGGGGEYQRILPPASAYKSGGGGGKKKAPPTGTGVPAAPTASRTMKPGDSGEDVRYAQYAMGLLGFQVPQDGHYDAQTEAAVKEMQSRLGVKKPNGNLSASQLHKLQDAVRLSPCVQSSRDLAFEADWEERADEDKDVEDEVDDDLEVDEEDDSDEADTPWPLPAEDAPAVADNARAKLERHRVLALIGIPVPQLVDDAPDETARAVLDALDEWVERQVNEDWEERKHDVSAELRIPGGKGGGRWTKNPVTNAIAKALEAWGKGDGPDDPFTIDGKPIDREPLRKAAVARGITLKRGASRDEIVAALKDDVKAAVKSAREAKKARESSAKFSITHGGKRIDVAVYTDQATGTKAILRVEDDSGRPGRVITTQPDLAGLEKWANDNGHTDIAGWAAKERGGVPKAPAKAAAGKWTAEHSDAFNLTLYKHSGDKGLVTEFHPDERTPKAVFRGQRGNKGGVRDFGSLAEAQAWVDSYDDPNDPLSAPPPRLGAAPKAPAKRVPAKKAAAKVAAPAKVAKKAGPSKAATPVAPKATTAPSDADVLAAYQRLSAGKPSFSGRDGGMVRITDLRKELPGTREQQDAALIRLGRMPGISVIPNEDQKNLTPADRADAVNIGGQPNHILIVDHSAAATIGKGDALKVAAVEPTGAQLAAVDRYGGDGAYVINNDLRAVDGRVADLQPKNRATVEALDALMNDSPLSQEIVVHRKLSLTRNPFSTSTTGEVDKLGRDLTGFSWTEPAYSSTSVGDEHLKHREISLRITVPAGTPAISHKALDNGEILLPRGLTFKVTTDHGGFPRHLDVEVVPKAETSNPLAGMEGLTTNQKRAKLRGRGLSKAEIDALVPLAPRKKAARSRELALLGVTRALGHDVTPGHDQLHHYWTRDPVGLAKWIDSPTPWTTLEHHLEKFVGPERAKRMAAEWFHERFGYWPGSDLNRVTHGKPPRGHRIGPG